LTQVPSVTSTNWTINGSTRISSIDTDTANVTVFYLDLTSSCVYALTQFTSSTPNLTKLHCGISDSVRSAFAFDWVTQNMYWLDGIFQWIAVQPLATTDNKMYRIIVRDEITDIFAFAVDPIKRQEFKYYGTYNSFA